MLSIKVPTFLLATVSYINNLYSRRTELLGVF